MHERIARQFRQLVLERQYVVTLHAYDEMAADSLSLWDVESALLNGEVLEQQRDRQSAEPKYRIGGRSLDGRSLEVVAKVGPTGKLVIITVYAV
jgi:hypothetical protein